jgi:hypothetical protein
MKHLISSAIDGLVQNGTKNGMKNGAKNGTHLKIKENVSTLVHKPERQTLPFYPKPGTPEWQFAIEDFNQSQKNPDWQKNRYTDSEGQKYFIERSAANVKGEGYKLRNEAKKRANIELQSGKRAEAAAAQTRAGTPSGDFQRNNPQMTEQPGVVYDDHHIVGLARARYLYEGLNPTEQQALTRYFQQYYGFFMGNHRGNAARLPNEVHKELHGWLRDQGWLERDGSLVDLSLKERKQAIQQFVEEQQRINEAMFAFQQDWLGNKSLAQSILEGA